MDCGVLERSGMGLERPGMGSGRYTGSAERCRVGGRGGLSFREGLCARCREKLEPEAGREGLTWSESEDEVTGLPECN